MSLTELKIRPSVSDDFAAVEEIRAAAFGPVFDSFRALLGEELYELVQARDEHEQPKLLASIFSPGSGWEIYVAEEAGKVIGFVCLRLLRELGVGEIGLNAVHPDHAGRGVGTAMYEFANERMRAEGMRAAMVSTGGDASHEPARRAYAKAGFSAGVPSVWLARRL